MRSFLSRVTVRALSLGCYVLGSQVLGRPSVARPDAGLQDDHRSRHPAHLLRQDQPADRDLSDPVAQTDGTAAFHATKQRNGQYGPGWRRRYRDGCEDERYLSRLLVRKSAGLGGPAISRRVEGGMVRGVNSRTEKRDGGSTCWHRAPDDAIFDCSACGDASPDAGRVSCRCIRRATVEKPQNWHICP